jgi:hypothetical protein
VLAGKLLTAWWVSVGESSAEGTVARRRFRLTFADNFFAEATVDVAHQLCAFGSVDAASVTPQDPVVLLVGAGCDGRIGPAARGLTTPDQGSQSGCRHLPVPEPRRFTGRPFLSDQWESQIDRGLSRTETDPNSAVVTLIEVPFNCVELTILRRPRYTIQQLVPCSKREGR